MTKLELKKEVERLQREINHCDAVHQEYIELKNSIEIIHETLTTMYDYISNVEDNFNDPNMEQVSKTLEMVLVMMRSLIKDI